jgi:CRISPR-associated endonuclease Csn1
MKKILGLDLGSNSIGWALMREIDGEVSQIIDLGSRIFNKAVEEGIRVVKLCALISYFGVFDF